MKRSRVIPALALTAALALAGCTGADADLGVSVDGTDYSVDQVQAAASELAAGGQAQQGGISQVISDLALLPVLEGLFAGSPAEITESQVRQSLAENGVEDPGVATLDAALSRSYQMKLGDPATFQDPAMADVLAKAQAITEEDLAAVDVDVNPRYGSWDIANGGVVPGTPEWIQSSNDS